MVSIAHPSGETTTQVGACPGVRLDAEPGPWPGVRGRFYQGLCAEWASSPEYRAYAAKRERENLWALIAAAYPWDWFVTLTYDRRRIRASSLGAADGRCNRVMRNYEAWLRRALEHTAESLGYGHDFRRSWLRGRRWTQAVWVAGVEPSGFDGAPHLHAVVCLPEFAKEARRDAAWSDWKRMWGFVRLEPPRAAGDAAAYVSKYVSKGELHLSETFNAYLGALAPAVGQGVATPAVSTATS